MSATPIHRAPDTPAARQALALAGVFQAASLVDELARTGQVDTCVHLYHMSLNIISIRSRQRGDAEWTHSTKVEKSGESKAAPQRCATIF